MDFKIANFRLSFNLSYIDCYCNISSIFQHCDDDERELSCFGTKMDGSKKVLTPSTTPKVLLARWWYGRGHITITKARVKNVIFDQHTHSFTPRTISPQEDQKWNLTYKNAEKRKQTTFVSRKTR